ncbi:MAG: hypothetical protein FWD52_09495, partial [Candidatus Bathyarchaeota archaeon]|nr:hypothetical protein [Candidatus Termiticorpusculum sp.]
TAAYAAAPLTAAHAAAAAPAAYAAARTAASAAAPAAADADAYADADADAYAARFRSILLDDLENIETKEYNFQKDITLYGEVWNNFQEALRDLGCNYWGEWYAGVFAKRFMLDVDDYKEIGMRFSVPGEIMEQGAAGVARYVMELKEKGVTRLNEARIILLGEAGAGKTSIAKRLIDPHAPMPHEERDITEGVDITSFTLRDICDDISVEQDANVYVWDFAGHAITHAAHRCFLSERCVYIILYDGRTEERNRLEYWLNHARDFGGRSQVFVLVNLRGAHRPEIEENYIRANYEAHNCKFYYFSIDHKDKKDDYKKLIAFRNDIAHFIANDPAWNKKTFPTNYFKAKDALKTTFSDNTDYIKIEKFREIVPDVNSTMLKALTELGICSYYDNIDILDMLVLNPRWITWGIYHIINWLKETNRAYKLKKSDFDKIFADNRERYPPEQDAFLYELMIKFELAYEDTERHVLVVPQCLKRDQPSEIPPFPEGNRLHTMFKAKHKKSGMPMPFPSAVMPRIIVRRSKEASFHLSRVWRYGAVLYLDNDTYAFVEQKDSIIWLFVTGKNSKDYHAMLLGTVLEVAKYYRSVEENILDISHELIMEESESAELSEQNDRMYPRQALKNLSKQGETVYDDKTRGIKIDVTVNNELYTVDKHVDIRNHAKGCNIQIIQPEDSIVNASQISISVNDLKKLKSFIENAKKEVASTANISDEIKDEVSKILKELEEIRKELVKDPSNRSLRENLGSKLKAIKEPAALAASAATLLHVILQLKG